MKKITILTSLFFCITTNLLQASELTKLKTSLSNLKTKSFNISKQLEKISNLQATDKSNVYESIEEKYKEAIKDYTKEEFDNLENHLKEIGIDEYNIDRLRKGNKSDITLTAEKTPKDKIYSFRVYPNLEYLTLQNYTFTSIQDIEKIASIVYLRDLTLVNCKLESEVSLVPLSTIKNLFSLKISNADLVDTNQLKGLTKCKKLARLDLENNKLKLTDQLILLLSQIPSLKSLNLSRNNIKAKDVEKLSNLANLKKLEILLLEQNSINSTLAIEKLGSVPLLESLNLSSNNIQFSDITKKAFLSFTQLKELSLTDNTFDANFDEMIQTKTMLLTPDEPGKKVFKTREVKAEELVKTGDFSFGGTGFSLHELYKHTGIIIKDIKEIDSIREISYAANKTISQNIIDNLKLFPSLESIVLNQKNPSTVTLRKINLLPKLSKLTINEGSLTPEQIIIIAQNKNLTELNLEKMNINQIKSFETIGTIENLRSLSLAENNIDKNEEQLFQHLSKLKNLQALDIGSNDLKEISSLKKLKGLRKLALYETKITDSAQLAESLSTLTNLRYLDLSYNDFKVSQELSNSISNLTSLEYLDITNIEMTKGEALLLMKGLSGLKNFSSLKLSSKNILTEDFLNELSKINSIQDLFLSEVGFSIVKQSLLTKTFQGLANLTSLSIINDKFSEIGLRALFASISKRDKLTFLDLSWNKIDNQGASAIANNINNYSSLRKLNLRNNKISIDGLKKIIKKLQRLTSLTKVDLSQKGLKSNDYKKLPRTIGKLEQKRKVIGHAMFYTGEYVLKIK